MFPTYLHYAARMVLWLLLDAVICAVLLGVYVVGAMILNRIGG